MGFVDAQPKTFTLPSSSGSRSSAFCSIVMPSDSMSTASWLVLSMVSCVSSWRSAVAMVIMLLSGPMSMEFTDATVTTAAATQASECVSLRPFSLAMVRLLTATVATIAASSATTMTISCGATDCTTAMTSSMLISSMRSFPSLFSAWAALCDPFLPSVVWDVAGREGAHGGTWSLWSLF